MMKGPLSASPEVRRRTGQHVLLIMDTTPGHFETFEEDNI